jgi:hypothetical protein
MLPVQTVVFLSPRSACALLLLGSAHQAGRIVCGHRKAATEGLITGFAEARKSDAGPSRAAVHARARR